MFIHMVWLGENYNHELVKYTQYINKNCEVKVWRDAELLPREWKDTYTKYATAPQLKSDLLRLCALRKYGGLYIDFDCVMKTDAYTITKDWNTLTIPSMCYSSILQGNILYCPKDWKYWNYVDSYVINYNNAKPSIITFDHFLYKSLPQESYLIENNCEKFPSEIKFITEKAQIIRYRSKITQELA